MSAEASPVTIHHHRYIREHVPPEDAYLARLREAAIDANIPPIWIAHEEAHFLAVLLRLIGAKRVIEVGTLAGYSAIAMARALPPDGHLDTIEISPKHFDFAKQWVAKSNVAGRVKVHKGAGMDVLPSFAANSVDAMFLDADKGSYGLYLEQALRIVRPDGLILADNALAFGQLLDPNPSDREVPAVRAFNDAVAKNRGVEGVIVPLGDGVWVLRKR
jgi:predicted O-methyltransferase YrrM